MQKGRPFLLGLMLVLVSFLLLLTKSNTGSVLALVCLLGAILQYIPVVVNNRKRAVAIQTRKDLLESLRFSGYLTANGFDLDFFEEGRTAKLIGEYPNQKIEEGIFSLPFGDFEVISFGGNSLFLSNKHKLALIFRWLEVSTDLVFLKQG